MAKAKKLVEAVFKTNEQEFPSFNPSKYLPLLLLCKKQPRKRFKCKLNVICKLKFTKVEKL